AGDGGTSLRRRYVHVTRSTDRRTSAARGSKRRSTREYIAPCKAPARRRSGPGGHPPPGGSRSAGLVQQRSSRRSRRARKGCARSSLGALGHGSALEEEGTSVRERDVAADGAVRAVPCLIAGHDQLGAD